MSVTSRAVVATAFGGPEVLRTVETAPTDPGPGNVLLEVRAAAVNPIDWKMYAAGPGNDPARLPIRLGLEVAGVVTAVGPSVRWLAPGDEVIAWRVTGGYASHLEVSEQVTCRRPQTLDWAAASGLLLAGTTAVHTLSATGTHDGDVLSGRVRPDGATTWVPEYLVLGAAPTGALADQVVATATTDRRSPLGVVCVGDLPGARWQLVAQPDGRLVARLL
ncbi:alcohol dehydrogenase catalytic domain-containing protein, partial [Cellulomonas septica]|uniref:alcohol dehydrogenase catalytic domain-containing protein n=1 Tax=Cellulomonas septica TaxID=285080 RepID=UPI0031B585F2